MDGTGFDTEVKTLLDSTYLAGMAIGSELSSEQLRIAIVATNLRALVNVLLAADTNTEINVDFKAMALGILGTVDFLEEAI